MLLLALDASTPATTVALVDTGRVLVELTHVDARRHAEVLATSVASVLDESSRAASELDGIVVGVGPGAFTGLRVGIASAHAFGDALGIPVYGVPTLDAMAYQFQDTGPFAVVIDARRRELFWAKYSNSRERIAGPSVAAPQVVAEEAASMPVVGALATPYGALFISPCPPDLPSAGALGQLADEQLSNGESLPVPIPVYLRRPDTSSPTASKSVLK